MAENDNPNYDTIIAKLKEQDEKIANLMKTNAEIIAMNKALLVTTDAPKSSEGSKDTIETLEQKLMKGLLK